MTTPLIAYWLGMVGTVAFAVTAVLAVAPKRVDVFGVVMLGVITAVGGGTIRDVTLGAPVFWSVDQTYLWLAVGAAAVAFFLHTHLARKTLFRLFLYLDALGISVFAVQATLKTWNLEFGRPLAPILLGVVTAIGGGLVRDVLAGRATLLMSRELYATPVLLGCAVLVGALMLVPEYRLPAALLTAFLIFALRAAAIHWKLHMPEWLVTRGNGSGAPPP